MGRLRRAHAALRANRDPLLGLALLVAAFVGLVGALVGFVVVVVAGLAALLGGS